MAPRRHRSSSWRTALAFVLGVGVGVFGGATLETPRLWLMRLRIPIESVDLAAIAAGRFSLDPRARDPGGVVAGEEAAASRTSWPVDEEQARATSTAAAAEQGENGAVAPPTLGALLPYTGRAPVPAPGEPAAAEPARPLDAPAANLESAPPVTELAAPIADAAPAPQDDEAPLEPRLDGGSPAQPADPSARADVSTAPPARAPAGVAPAPEIALFANPEPPRAAPRDGAELASTPQPSEDEGREVPAPPDPARAPARVASVPTPAPVPAPVKPEPRDESPAARPPAPARPAPAKAAPARPSAVTRPAQQTRPAAEKSAQKPRSSKPATPAKPPAEPRKSAPEGDTRAARSPAAVVQIGATPFRERAEQTVQGLRKKGFDAYVSGKSSPYRIRVRARSEQDAERTAARLKQLGHKVWVTTE